MRALLAAGSLAALLALLAACGGEEAAAPIPAAAPEASGPLENAAEAGAADVGFVLGCGAPFTPDATPATLAAVFGRENVVPETIDGPEGQPMNVTAIFPNDPQKRIEVSFANEEERTGLIAVTVRDHASLWKSQGGYSFGDDIAKVEAANGRPFAVSGFEWDYGGFVTDWKGGRLAETNNCHTTVRFMPESTEIAASISGDGKFPLSNDAAMKAARPVVALFGIGYPAPDAGPQ